MEGQASNMQITIEKQTFTVEETATLLGISRCLAYSSVKNGVIPATKIGRRYIVPESYIIKALGLQEEQK
jgi:excisionase family DNA binding protein